MMIPTAAIATTATTTTTRSSMKSFEKTKNQDRNIAFHSHMIPSFLLQPRQVLVTLLLLLLLDLRAFSTAESSSSTTTTTASSSSSCLPFTLTIPETVTYRPHQLIIAHRGASYSLPEHTLPAYRLGLELQADYIEPDLVASQDGVLFAVHTTDLNVTTNVATVFPHKLGWSNRMNRTGYWIYNFTASEIEQLTVQQRLPAARSTQFDGMFHIPRLEQILELLLEWNTQTLPQLLPKSYMQTDDDDHHHRPTQLQLRQAGLYAEFKDFNWILQEAGLNLVDLVLQHMQDFADLWKPLLDDKCYTQMTELRFDEYNKPGLIVQSFDIEALQEFSEKWSQHFTAEPVAVNGDDDDNNNNNSNNNNLPQQRQAPQPPAILLVNQHVCRNDPQFWYHVGNTWRGVIQGLGCEKSCILPSSLPSTSSSSDNSMKNEEGKEFRARAAEFQLVLHPWTERPEQEFLQQQQSASTSPIFDTVLDETRYLFCHLQVEGIFTESVATAVMAAHMPCDNDENNAAGEPTTAPAPAASAPSQSYNNNNNKGATSSMCYESEQEANLYTNLASFVMGLFVATFLSVWMHRKRRRRYGDGRAVPTAEEETTAATTVHEEEEFAASLELT